MLPSRSSCWQRAVTSISSAFSKAKDGETALQLAQSAGHAAIATLIRNTKQKGVKDVLLQASPDKIQKQQVDADRAMRELLEEGEKEKAAAAAGSQKKSKKKKAGGQGTASAFVRCRQACVVACRSGSKTPAELCLFLY
jgi:hypothetical protein